MKTVPYKTTFIKVAIVMAVALAFLMPSSAAFTTKATTSTTPAGTHPASIHFQKDTSATPLGRGTDVLASGEVGIEKTPAIVRDQDGTIWIFYIFDDGVDPQVYMRNSTDEGQTWSAPWYMNVDGSQTTPVATVDSDGMLWVAFIDEGQDTQYLLQGQDPTIDPTAWTWSLFTPSTQQVANHDCGGIATYKTDRTIVAFTYTCDIVYPPYSVPSAAVVTHNGDPTGYTFTWDSSWNGTPAQYTDIAATNTLFFFAFQYENFTVGKHIINVRWGDAVAQPDMELWKTQWGMWETPVLGKLHQPGRGRERDQCHRRVPD